MGMFTVAHGLKALNKLYSVPGYSAIQNVSTPVLFVQIVEKTYLTKDFYASHNTLELFENGINL